jgi:hypothetical protein
MLLSLIGALVAERVVANGVIHLLSLFRDPLSLELRREM